MRHTFSLLLRRYISIFSLAFMSALISGRVLCQVPPINHGTETMMLKVINTSKNLDTTSYAYTNSLFSAFRVQKLQYLGIRRIYQNDFKNVRKYTRPLWPVKMNQADLQSNQTKVTADLGNLQDAKTAMGQAATSYDNNLAGTGNFRFIFPTMSSAISSETFSNYSSGKSNLSIASNVQFQGQNGLASLYSELVSGNIGHLRVGFGSLIAANSSDSVNQQTLQTFLAGGGNSMVNITYPLVYYSEGFFTLLWQLSPRVGVQIPGLGAYTQNFTWNVSAGSDLYVDVTSSNKQIGFFAMVKAMNVWGSSDFYSNLEVAHNFMLVQLYFGMVLTNNFNLIITGPIASTYGSLLKFPFTLGIQLNTGKNNSINPKIPG